MNAQAILSGYGSLEIKRAYRKNMAIGMSTGATILLAIAVITLIYAHIAPPVIDKPAIPPTPIDINTWQPPNIIQIDLPKRGSEVAKPIPVAGIPVPVADEKAPDNAAIPTQDELSIIVNSHTPENLSELNPEFFQVENPEEILPSPTIFVPFEEPPQPVEMIQPLYPEMARQAGIEGEVWVKALIDREGRVRDVVILKQSGANAGFEEAAIEAARATSWKPAINMGVSVAVWISYKISFRLR